MLTPLLLCLLLRSACGSILDRTSQPHGRKYPTAPELQPNPYRAPPVPPPGAPAIDPSLLVDTLVDVCAATARDVAANTSRGALAADLESVRQEVAQVRDALQGASRSEGTEVAEMRKQVDAQEAALKSLTDRVDFMHANVSTILATVEALARRVSRLPSLLGDSCQEDSDCSAHVAHAVCGGAGVCSCGDGFEQVTHERCAKARRLAKPCSGASDCQGVVHATCADGACTCSAGFWNWRNAECRSGPDSFIVMRHGDALLTVSLDSPAHNVTRLPATGLVNAVGVDYDPVGDNVFWSDVATKKISRISASGRGLQETIVAGLGVPDGLAVDWMAGNLYWTDTGSKKIEVSRLDGSSRLVLLSEDQSSKPRGIALDPAAGHMYWTDWGDRPRIERAALDASRRQDLVNTGLVWPNGIALDLRDRRVYWCDAGTNRIEVVNMDGSGRRALVTPGDGKDPHFFGIALLGDFVYWTDWRNSDIERAHKQRGGREVVASGLTSRLMGLRAVKRSAELGSNPCSTNNGGCPHLCLYTPTGAVCRQPVFSVRP